MKILMLACADSIHTIRWSNAFASLGHQVHLVSMPDHPIKEDETIENVIIHFLRLPSPWGYYLNAFELKRLCNKINPDIINVHYASGYGTLARLSRIHPYVLSVWGSDVYDFPKQNKLNLDILRKNLFNADAIASTSKSMAEYTKRLLNDTSLDIEITPFGVDTNIFSPYIESDIKDDNTFLFGTIKKLTYKYGIDYIIKGFDIFLKRWKDSGGQGKVPKLYICGKGDKKAEFESLIKDLNIQKYVMIEGYIAHDLVAAKFRSFDVSVFGSQCDSESFGVSAVESMSCGTPVIVTDVSGFKEVVIDNETGFIVPRCNAEAIADRMEYFYYNDSIKDIMGQNGRKRVLKLYDWNKNVLQLEYVLEKNSKK